MIVKVRKENFGYVLFRQEDRKYFFVERNASGQVLLSLVREYFPGVSGLREIVVVPNRFPRQELILSAPIGMYLEISLKCNLNCGHCYKPEDINRKKMTLEQIKALIDELAAMGVFEIRLCGNEPTASKLFYKVARYIQSNGLYLGINTNGFFGEKKREELGSLNPNLVVVSIDGTSRTHTQIRGRGVYEKAIKLLEYLRSLNINCRINTVISKKTLGEIPDVAELASRLDCGVSFLPFRPVGKNSRFNRENAIDSNDMRMAVEEIMRQRERFPAITLLTYFDVIGKKAIYHHPIDRFNNPCPARKNGFISYSGDFFPCDFLRYAGWRFFCGNVTGRGFADLWANSENLKAFQCLQHAKCKRCRFYMKSCYGGCISGSIASTGSPDDGLCFVNVDDG